MRSRIRKELRLIDVIRVVSELARNDHEVGLVVADLLNRGLVKVRAGGRNQKTIVF